MGKKRGGMRKSRNEMELDKLGRGPMNFVCVCERERERERERECVSE